MKCECALSKRALSGACTNREQGYGCKQDLSVPSLNAAVQLTTMARSLLFLHCYPVGIKDCDNKLPLK